MRRLIIITVSVFCLSMAFCGLTMYNVHRTTTHMRRLRSEAILHMDAGEIQAVEETLSELANYLAKNSLWLEMVCDHGDIHQIKGEIIDAQASVEFGIEDDFYQAISRFGEGLDHIASVEEISWSNLC